MILLFPSPSLRLLQELAGRHFPGEEQLLVLCGQLPLGYGRGLPRVKISEFSPDQKQVYRLIANSMTYRELAPILASIASTGALTQVWLLDQDKAQAGLASWQQEEINHELNPADRFWSWLS